MDEPTIGAILLIALCVILVLLPPKYDPAIRIKEWQMKRNRPSCFADMPPNPQHQAEYDCPGCDHHGDCWALTKGKAE